MWTNYHGSSFHAHTYHLHSIHTLLCDPALVYVYELGNVLTHEYIYFDKNDLLLFNGIVLDFGLMLAQSLKVQISHY